MSTQKQPLPTHEQLVDTIIKMDARLENQTAVMKSQGEIINSLKKQLEKKSESKNLSGSTERFPTLEKFRGNRNTWDEWYLSAIHKLSKDGPVIGDEFDQFAYIYSRLEGEAARMVSTTAKLLSIDRKGNGFEFLTYLDTIFGDPNKEARAQQELYSLKQKDRESFATFLPKFETTLATAGWSVYGDIQKISLLKNALSKEMRTALIGKKLPTTWSECTSELLTISSEIIAIDQQFKPHFAGTPSTSKTVENLTAMDWEPIKSASTETRGAFTKRATWVSKETLTFRKKKGLCVRCGHKGHIAPNCKLLPPLNKNLNTNTSQLIYDEEEYLILAKPEEIDDLQGKDELL